MGVFGLKVSQVQGLSFRLVQFSWWKQDVPDYRDVADASCVAVCSS